MNPRQALLDLCKRLGDTVDWDSNREEVDAAIDLVIDDAQTEEIRELKLSVSLSEESVRVWKEIAENGYGGDIVATYPDTVRRPVDLNKHWPTTTPCPLVKGMKNGVSYSVEIRLREARQCEHTTNDAPPWERCGKPVGSSGVFCTEHGCCRCGATILADYEDERLCLDCGIT